MTVDVDEIKGLLDELESIVEKARTKIAASEFFDDLLDPIAVVIEKAAKIKAAFTVELASSKMAIARLETMLEHTIVYKRISDHRALIEALNNADKKIDEVISKAAEMLIELEGIIEEDRQEE